MIQDKDYIRRWKNKKEWYRSQGILPYEEGGGEKGVLIVTEDTKKGGIQSDEIRKLIKKIFNK